MAPRQTGMHASGYDWTRVKRASGINCEIAVLD
jgi:hypothetical protein